MLIIYASGYIFPKSNIYILIPLLISSIIKDDLRNMNKNLFPKARYKITYYISSLIIVLAE